MKKTNKFSPEVRERAVSMVQEQRGGVPVTVGGHAVHHSQDWLRFADLAQMWQTNRS